jgi:hypothetical protein
MNQLNLAAVTSSVGLYPRAEELEQLQNAIIQLSQSINGGFTEALQSDVSNVYVIFGCVITSLGGGNYSCTQGAIYYNGEIYTVEAVVSVAVTGTSYKFGITETYGTAGALTDGTTTNDLVNKVGVFYGTSTPANTTNIFINGSFRTLVRITSNIDLKTAIDTINTTLTTIQTQGTWVAVSTPSGYTSSSVNYRANGNFVSLRGVFAKTGVGNGTISGALPVGARPVTGIQITAVVYGGGYEVVQIGIDTNGDIVISGATAAYNNLSLDNIHFYTN